MIENKQRNRKMKQIVYSYLTNKIKYSTAVQKLKELGFTELEAKFELKQWVLK